MQIRHGEINIALFDCEPCNETHLSLTIYNTSIDISVNDAVTIFMLLRQALDAYAEAVKTQAENIARNN